MEALTLVVQLSITNSPNDQSLEHAFDTKTTDASNNSQKQNKISTADRCARDMNR
jgi:hypothetical protein